MDFFFSVCSVVFAYCLGEKFERKKGIQCVWDGGLKGIQRNN
jgi:hypothetical protein